MAGHAEDNFLDIPVKTGMGEEVHRNSEIHLGKYLKFLD